MMNNKMIKKAYKLQKQMKQMQDELEGATFKASAGGGMVTAVVSGNQRLESIEINPASIDLEDIEMLQDMVQAAINEALDESQKVAASRLSGITGGFNIPGLT